MISDSTGNTRQEEMAATMSEDNAEREERASTSLNTVFSASASPSAEPATEGVPIELTVPLSTPFSVLPFLAYK